MENKMTGTELRLRDTLAELMEVDACKVSVTKTFGEQGVDSVIGLRFVRKLEDLLGASVELEWLFDHPTIRQLSGFLDQQKGAGSSSIPFA